MSQSKLPMNIKDLPIPDNHTDVPTVNPPKDQAYRDEIKACAERFYARAGKVKSKTYYAAAHRKWFSNKR